MSKWSVCVSFCPCPGVAAATAAVASTRKCKCRVSQMPTAGAFCRVTLHMHAVLCIVTLGLAVLVTAAESNQLCNWWASTYLSETAMAFHWLCLLALCGQGRRVSDHLRLVREWCPAGLATIIPDARFSTVVSRSRDHQSKAPTPSVHQNQRKWELYYAYLTPEWACCWPVEA
jgi:hypothetical protein